MRLHLLACVATVPFLAGAAATSAPTVRQEMGCGKVLRFSGNGGTNLGTWRLARETTLAWTNDGAIFQIFTESGVPVNSQARRGTSVLAKGTYRKVQVNAIGNWRITLTPRCGAGTPPSGVYRFAGDGGKNLGTIRTRRESVLIWTNTGAIFQIFSDSGIPVNSQAHSGRSILDAGTYRNVQVNAVGRWTILIKPR